jgi:uncharacterized protein
VNVALVLTHACNLACSYCYTGEKKVVRMHPDVARRALDLGFASVDDRAAGMQVTFFGGEPLLEHDLLVSVAKEARERAARVGCPLKLQVTTNGTLLTEARAAELAELEVHVALSLDGTRSQHEAGRPLAGGGSSYDAAMRSLDVMIASKTAFDVISVVDPANVAELSQGVEDLLARGVASLTLNPNWGGAWTDELLGVWSSEYERMAAIFVSWMRRGRVVRIEPLESAMQALLAEGSPEVLGDGCGAGTRRVAVAPSGRIYACARSVGVDDGQGAIGHLDEGFVTRRSKARGAPECDGCESSERCDRHCACACAEETGDSELPGPVLCHHRHSIEDLASRVVALLESEQNPTFVANYPSRKSLR